MMLPVDRIVPVNVPPVPISQEAWAWLPFLLLSSFAIHLVLKRQHEKLSRSGQYLRRIQFFMSGLIEHCPLPLVVKDRKGRIVLHNRRAAELYNRSSAELVGRHVRDIFSGAEANHFDLNDQKVIESGAVHEQDHEGTVGGHRVHNRVVKFPLFDGNNQVNGTGTYVIELTEFKNLEGKLERHTHYDQITGLPGRELLLRDLEQRIAKEESEFASFSLVLMSFDGIERIERVFGRGVRDKALVSAIDRVKKALEKHDLVAVPQGRTVAIVHPHCQGARKTDALARAIINKFNHPISVDRSVIFLIPQIGIAEFPNHGSSAEELLANAQIALEDCKSKGIGKIAAYEPTSDRAARRRIEIETQLRNALTRNEFQLSFQPQIEARTGDVAGAEALLRWYNPDLGYVSPSEFIPVAEETGLVLPIERWVLETACHEAAKWDESGLADVRVAVNVSATQLLSRDFVRFVSRVIRESGLPSRRLEIEITERLVLEGGDAVSHNLTMLKKLNVKLAIDDFGTGYSSLQTLKNFPFNVVKIDKSFVDDISNNAEDLALTKTIVAMAQNLGLKTVAEGVETEHQRKLLHDLEVDMLQGFFYSRPVTAYEFRQYLKRHSTRVAA